MLSELLQEQAALYVAGTMTAQQREQFELVIEFHDEFREFVTGWPKSERRSRLPPCVLAMPEPSPAPKIEFSTRSPMSAAGGIGAFVMSGPDGLVQWINPAFSRMCGYTLEELRGKKLGPILQGEKTDQEAANRMQQRRARIPALSRDDR